MADSPDDFREDESHLAELGGIFMKAMDARQKNNSDRAQELLRLIVRREPRLPEPHLELAHIQLEAGRAGEAEVEVREAIRLFEAGGQWIDVLPEATVRSLAHNLLGELLRRRADSDDVVFGDPARYVELLNESRVHFQRAAALDPENEHARFHALTLGPDGEE